MNRLKRLLVWCLIFMMTIGNADFGMIGKAYAAEIEESGEAASYLDGENADEAFDDENTQDSLKYESIEDSLNDNLGETESSSASESVIKTVNTDETADSDESQKGIEFRDDDIAHGTYQNIIWAIDANGKLTVEGSGEFSNLQVFYRAPWCSIVHREKIKDATVRITGVKNASHMFHGCRNLESVDLSGLDTSSITNMGSMFHDCWKLTSLDVSGLDTSSVANMESMFYNCRNLTSLDVSGLDTSSVTNMSSMFYGCSGLTGLDLSELDTSSVTNMSGMFRGCSGLTGLDLSGLDTSSVTNMQGMFSGCNGLTGLDLSELDTSSVTNMISMFNDCRGLTSLDVSSFDMSSVTDMYGMFSGCRNLTSLDVSGFDTSSAINIGGMFMGCNSLTSLDVSGFNTSRVTYMSYMFSYCSSLTSLDVSDFDTSSVTNMSGMFSGCSSLTSLDVSDFDTSSVTNMGSMFNGCSGLISLDVSGFDTSNVTSISAMFYDCRGLTSLDLSELDTSSVTDMYGMFYGCCKLKSLDLSSFDTSSVTDMSNMFYDCSGLTSLDVSGFDTSNVTDMSNMFYDCSGLMSLDLSGFDTSSVTDMSNMFYECSGLTSLDLSGFDTSSVTDMSNMFYECIGLTSLDVSGFDTSSVTNMGSMFYSCSGLTSLDVSGFKTGIVTDMSNMFCICSGLTSLDLSGFDTSSVTDMSHMFSICNDLTSLDVSGFNTGSVTDMRYMFVDCCSLTSLDVSGFDTSSVTCIGGMFVSCSGLTSLDLSGFDTSNVTDMSDMFRECSNLTGLDLSGFDTSSVTDMSYMFRECSSLTSLDLSNFDTSSVTDMNYMFLDCSSLTSLDLSNFDTSKVTNMNGMFWNCSSLTSLDVSNFDTSSVTNMGYVFEDCSGLTTLYTPCNVPTPYCGLPTVEKTDVWYDAAGATYTKLSEGLDYSIILMRNTKPDAAMSKRLTVLLAKSSYEQGSTVAPEDLIVRYRGTDGRTATLSNQGEGGEVAAYTMSAVDMSTPGTKTLTISYNDGTGTLTKSVTFKVYAPLTESMVTLPEADYVYTGKNHKPVPIVKFTDGTELIVGKDYFVSYTDNVNAGEASLVIKGRNAYGGMVMRNFTIQKATPKNVEVTYSEPCQIAQENRTQDLSACFDRTAPNNGGITDYTIGEVTEHNTVANGEGSVLSAEPSIDDFGMLTYSTNAGTAGDTVLIPVTVTFEENYKDALILVTVCLKDTENPSESESESESASDSSNESESASDSSNESESASDSSNESESPSESESESESASESSNESESASESESESESASESSNASESASGNASESEASSESSNESESSSGSTGESEASSESSNESESASESPSESEPVDSTGLHVTFLDGRTYTYTGSPIQPMIEVTNNGETLTEDIDYTVKYSNNTKAGTAKITITGKSSFTGKQDTTFTIEPKSLSNIDNNVHNKSRNNNDIGSVIAAEEITIATNSKAAPVLIYNGVKLSAKDYTLSNTGKITADEVLTITGKGNYKDEITVKVKVAKSPDKFKVNMKKDKIVYNGNEQRLGFEVLDSKTKQPLKEDEYMAVYSDNVTDAGTVKVTIIGLGSYTGSVTKSYKINPLKTDMELSFDKQKTYTYNSAGTTVDDIEVKVKSGGQQLDYGKDYKVTYSSNKKTGTGKINVTFLGNYKGSKAIKDTFTITPAVLDDSIVNVIVPDKVYTGKKNAYKSEPIVTDISGNILKKSDYTVNYYNSSDMKEENEIKGKNNLIELGENEDYKTVYVKITGKGNYAGDTSVYAAETYDVKKTAVNVLDISKAKVTFVNEGAKVKKLEYTGLPLTPDTEVTIKVKGVGNVTLDKSQYDITWSGNVNKGKATAVITGNGKEVNGYAFAGSKKATISITAGNLKNAHNLFGEKISNLINDIF